MSRTKTAEKLVPLGAVHELVGLKAPSQVPISRTAHLNVLNIKPGEGILPALCGKWVRVRDVERCLRLEGLAHPQMQALLEAVADQIVEAAGMVPSRKLLAI